MNATSRQPGAPIRILVVNPNTTAAMTRLIGASAREAVGAGVVVDAVNPSAGPESLESHYDDAMAAPHVLDLVARGEAEGYDGHVIACFGDPALLAAREIATGPVVGIAEAAMRTASYLGRRYSVVTTLARTIGHAWDIASSYGTDRQCAGIHACEIPVVELETDPAARSTIRDACRSALERDASDVLVLGCAGMADLARELSRELGVPVVDGVAAATAEVEKLVRLGLSTSKSGELAPPPAKVRRAG